MDLVFRNLTTDHTLKEGFFVDVLDAAVNEVGLPAGQAGFKNKKVELSLNLVGEGKIRSLNKKYRGKNKVTDVLSFGMDYKTSGKCDIISLGDIFICLPFAKKQARKEGIELKKELSRLVVHGFLHLLGYDHEKSSKDTKIMLGLEEKILAKLMLN